MALSLGKKKQEVAETDWSEDALLDDDAPDPVVVEPATTTPFDEAAPKKKPLLKIALAALLVLGLGGGAAAYFMMSGAPEEDEAPIIAERPGKPDKIKPPAVKPETPKKPVVVEKPVKPAKPEKSTKAEKMGFKPDDNKTLVFQSFGPGAPHVVPGPMVPTPVQPPTGLAGTPGRYGSRNVEIVAVGGDAPIPEELQTQLDALWQQGAAAKHSGDNAAARQAWQQILQLSPAHPGIQDAINKLPQ